MYARLLPNRSPVAWGSQRIALGALIFHSNTFHFICWAPKFSVFSSEGPFKIFLGSSLVCMYCLVTTCTLKVMRHSWNVVFMSSEKQNSLSCLSEEFPVWCGDVITKSQGSPLL